MPRVDHDGRVLAVIDLQSLSMAEVAPYDAVRRGLQSGIRVFLLRGKGASDAAIASTPVAQIQQEIARFGGRLILHAETAWPEVPEGIFGYHAGAAALWEQTDARADVDGGALSSPRPRGYSCHSAQELARAQALGARWATLSPFAASSSKPGYGPALGVEGLRNCARGCSVPVFALAGVSASTARGIARSGVAGVAVMGLMSALEPGPSLQALLQVMEEEHWLVHPPW